MTDGEDVFMRKNGKIEFYRFVFCVFVLLFHSEKEFAGLPSYTGARLTFFAHGSMGVEFFLLVSGYLLARTAFSRQSSAGSEPLFSHASSADSIRFLIRKYIRIFPMHMVAFILTMVLQIICTHMRFGATLFYFLDSIPSFFLVQMAGLLNRNVIPVEWYLSCMLISMAVIYPLCRRCYYGFTRYLSPLVALFIYGILYHNTKALTGVLIWSGPGYKSLFRAFAGILLGTSAFEISRILSSMNTTGSFRKLLRMGEVLSFLLVAAYCVSSLPTDYEFLIAFLLFFLLVCITSEKCQKPSFFDSRFVSLIGEYSFPLYLSQVAAINLVHIYWKESSLAAQIWIYLGFTLMIAIFVNELGKYLDRRMFRRFLI